MLKEKIKASIPIFFLLYVVPVIFLILALTSLTLLALQGLQNDMSKIEIFIVGSGYIVLLFLSIVGLDKITLYLLTPKNERGDFWSIKQVCRIWTIDLSKLRTETKKLGKKIKLPKRLRSWINKEVKP